MLRVHVTYCGSAGNMGKYQKLKKELQDIFPGKLMITGEDTPTTTGYFEVNVGDDVLHSKKDGEGDVDTDEKLQKIVQGIKVALGDE